MGSSRASSPGASPTIPFLDSIKSASFPMSRHLPVSRSRLGLLLLLPTLILVIFFLTNLPEDQSIVFTDIQPEAPPSKLSSTKLWLGLGKAKSPPPSSSNPILNETLGFEKIFTLALADRKDRTEPLLRGARATNINITILDAVRDKNIPEKERPDGWIDEDHAPGVLGCLTSHMRAWKKIVREGIHSALILEDDADWDLRLHSTLQGVKPAVDALLDFPFATTKAGPGHHPHVRTALPTRPPSPAVAPYGENWDILVLGHCSSGVGKGDARYFEFNDTSAPPEDKRWAIDSRKGPGEKYYTEGTRAMYLLQEGGGFVCTYAYAISHDGAKKMLKHLDETNAPVDLAMSGVCTDNADMNCVAMYPQIINTAGGRSSIGKRDAADEEELERRSDEQSHEAGRALARRDRHSKADSDSTKSKPAKEGAKECDQKCIDTLPAGGATLQYSARRNAPIILDYHLGPADLVPAWETMFTEVEVVSEVEKDVPSSPKTSGSRGSQIQKSISREWKSVSLDAEEAFDPAVWGQGLPWLARNM